MIKPKISKRLFWGQETPNLPSLDLAAIQRNSYQWFLNEGIAQSLAEISPIEDFTGKNWLLEFGQHSFGKPKYSPAQALEKGLTYDLPLKVDLPGMTEQGTFIINGVERCVVNQLIRSPGVFFTGEADLVTGRMLYSAELRPLHGSWLEFNVGRNDVLTVRIDRRRKFPVTTFLRAIGPASNEELLSAFAPVDKNKNHQFITTTIEHDQTQGREEAILEIYRKMRPGEPVVFENAKTFLDNLFFNHRRYDLGKVGRYKLNKKLGLDLTNITDNYVLTKDDIIATIAYLIKLQNGDSEVQVDDIDHLANRRARCAGELVATNALRIGLLRLERTIREKMSLASSS
ncbi:DNA-directed RNA polymerase subunit beta, partial [Candidatus Gottesmanbacteria bacterium]|nr:DNA-directed RNA polymerase subunit beta [Candidatus Gottesmanbacteria bacterium]